MGLGFLRLGFVLTTKVSGKCLQVECARDEKVVLCIDMEDRNTLPLPRPSYLIISHSSRH